MSRTLSKLPRAVDPRFGERVVLLHQGAGSTIDHFPRGPLEALGARILEENSTLAPDAAVLHHLDAFRLVVMVRYLPRPWMAPLRRLRRDGTCVAFLMDDALLDHAARGPANTHGLHRP